MVWFIFGASHCIPKNTTKTNKAGWEAAGADSGLARFERELRPGLGDLPRAGGAAGAGGAGSLFSPQTRQKAESAV